MVGNHSATSLMSDMTPSSRTQEPANTGTITRLVMALPKSPSSSSWVISSPSRYFIISSSSASTASSTSCACAASAVS